MMSDHDGEDDYKDKEGKEIEKKLGVHAKSYTDIQRIKLEKLMANPDKPVHIPERAKEKNVNKAPEFCHNIMGSSAGAGSGEFHLYRQMRRKEQVRLKVLSERRDRDELNEAYHQKLEENEKAAEDRTARKRKKRQNKKKNQKNKSSKNPGKEKKEAEESESESSGGEEESGEGGVGGGADGSTAASPSTVSPSTPLFKGSESADKKKTPLLVIF